MNDYNEEQLIKAVVNSNTDTIERFLGRKIISKTDDIATAVVETLMQMPDDEIQSFYNELCISNNT